MKQIKSIQEETIPNVKVLEIFTPTIGNKYELPVLLEAMSAGFLFPADDYLESKLDLNDYLIKNPSATFFLSVTGDSMINAGVHPGDILIVDRSLNPKHRSIVIAAINGELIVKRLQQSNNKFYLHAENTKYEPIEITKEMAFEVWGVVTNVIHSLL
jgi:DNA polymerase V